MSYLRKAITQTIPQVFDEFKGPDGLLDMTGYRLAVVLLLNYEPADWETCELFQVRSFMNLEEFSRIVLHKMNFIHFENYLQEAFMSLDEDCKGFISLADVKQALKTSSSKLEWSVLRESFCDVAEDGIIDFFTFYKLFITDRNFPDYLLTTFT